MATFDRDSIRIPLKEKLKSIPGFFGLRLEEEPHYSQIRKEGPFEIREYDPILIARVTIHGDHQEASEEAFLRLAAYIFGRNQGARQLPMTTPVFRQEGETLEMTAPVFEEKETGGDWTMSFYLPKELTLETAPRPLNGDVRLLKLPAQTMACLRYSGVNDEGRMEEKAMELIEWLSGQTTFEQVAAVRWAQYDGPYTIPFLRRNEVQVEVKPIH